MKEKFEPFKELLKALREIKCAIGCKNSGAGNGNDIVLPKYVYGYVQDTTSNARVERLLENDYEGRIYDFRAKIEFGVIDPSQLTEEERTNFTELVTNYAMIPATHGVSNALYVYTKEQKDAINKNSIIMGHDGTITKLNDFVFVDLCDFIVATHIPSTLDIEKGQYYTIMHPLEYNNYINNSNTDPGLH